MCRKTGASQLPVAAEFQHKIRGLQYRRQVFDSLGTRVDHVVSVRESEVKEQ
jgi:hypothetical protein